jgi:hypothetical protein
LGGDEEAASDVQQGDRELAVLGELVCLGASDAENRAGGRDVGGEPKSASVVQTGAVAAGVVVMIALPPCCRCLVVTADWVSRVSVLSVR